MKRKEYRQRLAKQKRTARNERTVLLIPLITAIINLLAAIITVVASLLK